MNKLIVSVREKLNSLSDLKFKQFSSTIVKNKHHMVGVKIPVVRTIAKEIAKTNAVEFLNNNPLEFYEEVLLQGMVIGYSKIPDDVKFEYLKLFIPKILDWSECDSVVSTLKFFKNNLNKTYNFLLNYFNSENEFEKRFAIVSFMTYFLTDDYYLKILKQLLSVKSDYYYVNMAVAWALSVCFVKYYNQTMQLFKNSNLSDFVYNKTIQKCCESFRITAEQKIELKNLNRK